MPRTLTTIPAELICLVADQLDIPALSKLTQTSADLHRLLQPRLRERAPPLLRLPVSLLRRFISFTGEPTSGDGEISACVNLAMTCQRMYTRMIDDAYTAMEEQDPREVARLIQAACEERCEDWDLEEMVVRFYKVGFEAAPGQTARWLWMSRFGWDMPSMKVRKCLKSQEGGQCGYSSSDEDAGFEHERDWKYESQDGVWADMDDSDEDEYDEDEEEDEEEDE